MSELLADFSFSSIIAGLIFGVFGLVAFRRGKKNANMRLLFIGLALMIYPYFVSNAWISWTLGFALCVIMRSFW